MIVKVMVRINMTVPDDTTDVSELICVIHREHIHLFGEDGNHPISSQVNELETMSVEPV